MTDKKYEYKVLSPVSVSAKYGAKDAQVGDVVKLTEHQAKNRVNKVQLLSDWEVMKEKTDENSNAATKTKEAEREALQKEIAAREQSNASEIARHEQKIEDAKTDPEEIEDDEHPNYEDE